MTPQRHRMPQKHRGGVPCTDSVSLWNGVFLWCGRTGQSLAEYAVLLGVVVAVIVAMQVYARRGIQAVLKISADELSPFGTAADPDGELAQLEGMRQESGDPQRDASGQPIVAPGMALARESGSTTAVNRAIHHAESLGGGMVRTIQTDTMSSTGALPSRGAGVTSYSETIIGVAGE